MNKHPLIQEKPLTSISGIFALLVVLLPALLFVVALCFNSIV